MGLPQPKEAADDAGHVEQPGQVWFAFYGTLSLVSHVGHAEQEKVGVLPKENEKGEGSEYGRASHQPHIQPMRPQCCPIPPEPDQNKDDKQQGKKTRSRVNVKAKADKEPGDEEIEGGAGDW